MVFDNNTCNRAGCGQPIIWRHPITKQALIHKDTNRPRPLNPDGSPHMCMKKGQSEYFKPRPMGEKILDYT